jgi:glycosyltransferase involved in cell wall biosynthesis
MIEQPARALVTVAMPIYNAGPYLRLAVLSIVAQTFEEWELLIIDDGSADNALEGIADIRDRRIRIFRDGLNKGLAVRLNEACAMAAGKFLARMDQDDVSYPERLARQLAVLQGNLDVDLVATRAVIIDEGNRLTGLFPWAIAHEEICSRPWGGFLLPHPTWMGRLEWFHKHGYAEPGPYFCEDQELLLRTHESSRFHTVDEILFAYRIRSKTNWKKLGKTRRTLFLIQFRHFLRQKKFYFILLSTAGFVAKSCFDFLKRMRNEENFPVTNISQNAEKGKWQQVLGALSERAE